MLGSKATRVLLVLATAGAGGVATAPRLLALSSTTHTSATDKNETTTSTSSSSTSQKALTTTSTSIHMDEETSLKKTLRQVKHGAQESLGLDVIERFGRTFIYGLITSIDYKSLSFSGLEKDSEEYKKKQAEVHLRSAKRILYVCQAHGGVYTKAGQYISSLVKIVPDEYSDTLRALQDQNPGEPFADVCRVIQEDLGIPVQELYATFDPKPIAAASLAQVHVATTKETGETVAVKVQYPRLESQTRSDFWTLKTLATAVGFLFPDWEYTWLFPELEESVKLELDFLQEATNAERISALFAGDRRIHVPKIKWDLSSHRVLTMEFIDNAVKVNNVKGLQQKGINPVAVGECVSHLFSLMIFSAGLVHCDPHSGNIFIRHPPPAPTRVGRWWQKMEQSVGLRANFEVVLLDHGLYRRLNETFRQNYCNLWKAFMTRDEKLGRAATRALGLDEEYFELMSIISVNRTPRSTTSLGVSMSDDERKRIREKYKDRSKYGAEQLKQLIEGLPRDILFVLRSNSLVRSLNTELGGSVGGRFRIFGSSAVEGLSMPAVTAEELPEEAYFLDEIRDYSQVLPGGKGRVMQKRRKVEMIDHPEASLNKSTASEAFFFSSPLLLVAGGGGGGENEGGQVRLPPRRHHSFVQELRRRLVLVDLRFRVWAMDAAIEWFLWVRAKMPVAGPLGGALPPGGVVAGEKMVQEQLHVDAK